MRRRSAPAVPLPDLPLQQAARIAQPAGGKHDVTSRAGIGVPGGTSQGRRRHANAARDRRGLTRRGRRDPQDGDATRLAGRDREGEHADARRAAPRARTPRAQCAARDAGRAAATERRARHRWCRRPGRTGGRPPSPPRERALPRSPRLPWADVVGGSSLRGARSGPVVSAAQSSAPASRRDLGALRVVHPASVAAPGAWPARPAGREQQARCRDVTDSRHIADGHGLNVVRVAMRMVPAFERRQRVRVGRSFMGERDATEATASSADASNVQRMTV